MGGYWHRLSPVSVGTGSVCVRFNTVAFLRFIVLRYFLTELRSSSAQSARAEEEWNTGGTTPLFCPKRKGRGGAGYLELPQQREAMQWLNATLHPRLRWSRWRRCATRVKSAIGSYYTINISTVSRFMSYPSNRLSGPKLITDLPPRVAV